MPLTPERFHERLEGLRGKLIEQGRRMVTLVETAFDAMLMHDHAQAASVEPLERAIDEADIEIDRLAAALLTEAATEAVPLKPEPIWSLLTLVKINNDFERTADAGVTIAERALALRDSPTKFPPTTRVMTNSVLGILRDVVAGYERRDAALARLVLKSDDAVSLFKAEILQQAERAVADGAMGVDLAFDLHELASQCTLMSEHAADVAEQVIYEATGVIVRHGQETPPGG